MGLAPLDTDAKPTTTTTLVLTLVHILLQQPGHKLPDLYPSTQQLTLVLHPTLVFRGFIQGYLLTHLLPMLHPFLFLKLLFLNRKDDDIHHHIKSPVPPHLRSAPRSPLCYHLAIRKALRPVLKSCHAAKANDR